MTVFMIEMEMFVEIWEERWVKGHKVLNHQIIP